MPFVLIYIRPGRKFLFLPRDVPYGQEVGFERMGKQHGSVIKVSPDGKDMSIYASGFRAPNGIGVGPNGEVTTGDNEGSFVPSSALALGQTW